MQPSILSNTRHPTTAAPVAQLAPGLTAPAERPVRLVSVLRVVCLVFNEGHSARAAGLADVAIRLARLLQSLLPEQSPK